MATVPSASVTLASATSATVSGADLICVIAPVATSADAIPRLYGSASAVYDQHGYSEGVEYVSLHTRGTKLPVLFVGIPIVTAGAVSREDTTGNTGTSVTTLTEGVSGALAEHDGILTVITGGTVGTDQIILGLSLDGGLTTRRIRLGTSTSYVIPYIAVTVSFTVGTLVAGDTIHTWHGSGPLGDSTGWSNAFTALAAQQLAHRSTLVCGDMSTDTQVTALTTLAGTYESTHHRYGYLRVGVTDRLPLAAMSKSTHRMSTSNVTFAEVGASGDTITRATGTWAADGFATGDMLVVTGSSSNNITCAQKVTVTSGTVITLGTDDLVNEGPVGNVTIVGKPSLTFAAAGDTITRAGGSPGSWVTDGFRVGDIVTITGTVSNNVTLAVTAVTATVLTLANGLTDEVIALPSATITAGQTKAAWMAAITTEFAPVDDQHRVDLSAGKGRVFSEFSGWYLRWPAAWAASVREYQHDLHTATWRKADGPTGWLLHDSDGALVEWDDAVDGGAASAARFTSFRTYGDPQGAFITMSLTRALDASLLVQTHNTAVVQRAQAICHAATEAAIGKSLIKKADGTAEKSSLAEVESFVNTSLENDLLANKKGEGPRVSSVVWAAATDDDFSVAEPVLNGTLTINIRGTIHTVNTQVKVS